MIWEDAKTYCETIYESLAVVQTADDWERLTAEADRHGLTVTGWIGLYNITIWLWTVYEPPMNITLLKWAPGQPDNFGGNEKCVAMVSNGYWADYSCSELKPFICYNATFGGLIAIPSPAMDWDASRSYCLTYHTDLASPKNETKNNEFQQLVSHQGTSWIGISRRGWTWSNGVEAFGLPWCPGHLSNADQNNNCGLVNNSLFEDKQCDNKYYFFCHTPYTVRQQVMKLQFRGDDSVFDPASQAAILQQYPPPHSPLLRAAGPDVVAVYPSHAEQVCGGALRGRSSEGRGPAASSPGSVEGRTEGWMVNGPMNLGLSLRLGRRSRMSLVDSQTFCPGR
ncbi:hypothetical protein QTP70_000328 [Hemibagrus guttatus]|uniref:C-type lectin domain-containing protein n=1 Tax=Hemibagrus guttatus TaxID=175788 RepID=A0AAE0PRX3_9TELE|nr:hypothetical protein QTP70_000328 [Hemibagrus guttatus]